MLRFRTMEDIQLPPRSNHRLRETRVGHVIRNYSVDDLLNLWNVLQGDMSIVGPRPTEPHIVEQNPEWRRILSVRPVGLETPAYPWPPRSIPAVPRLNGNWSWNM
jgi:lipopolysaccharide/colanic/teichoic acid biosynthesis glycosyltransferase